MARRARRPFDRLRDDRPRRLARGPQRDRLRDADRRRRDRSRCSSSIGLSGAFFQPLAIAYVLAVLASLARRADGHAGARPHPAAQRADRAPRVADRATPAGVPTARSSQRIVQRSRPAYVCRRWLISLAGRDRLPQLGQSLLPDFKERDFLMHWVTAPGTSLAGGGPDPTDAVQRAARRSRVSATSARTSARPSSPTRSSAIDFGENWISVDPAVDYDKTLAAIQEVVDGYPGHPARRADLPQGTDPRGPHRIERRDRHPDLRRRPRTSCARQADEVEEQLDKIPGIIDLHTRAARPRSRRSSVEVDLAAAERYGLKPGDVRRTRRRPASPARRSATSSSAAARTTSRSGACPRRATA